MYRQGEQVGSRDKDMLDGDKQLLNLKSPLLAAALRYWRSKKTGDLLPGRDAIDPLELPSVLPWLNLVDVIKDGNKYRFRHRLIGTGLVERFGRDSTGAWFDDIYDPEVARRHMAYLSEVVRDKRIDVARVPMPIPEKNFITYTRLVLPLASDGTTVDMIMVVLDFDEEQLT